MAGVREKCVRGVMCALGTEKWRVPLGNHECHVVKRLASFAVIWRFWRIQLSSLLQSATCRSMHYNATTPVNTCAGHVQKMRVIRGNCHLWRYWRLLPSGSSPLLLVRQGAAPLELEPGRCCLPRRARYVLTHETKVHNALGDVVSTIWQASPHTESCRRWPAPSPCSCRCTMGRTLKGGYLLKCCVRES